ncbi:MAG: ABC transporter substrate-binding protein [Ardenticatenaceae bacterium]
MIIRYIRWQLLLTAIGLALLLLMLTYISSSLEMILLPQAGGTYIEGIPARPDNLNPLYIQNTNQAEQDLATLIFNGLTRANQNGLLVPDLATEWLISDDSRTYTFFLRDDAFWHDGTPFSAEDVAFTVAVIQDPDFTGTVPAIELWRTVDFEVVDPTTIRFTLPVEVAPFAPFVSFTTFGILPKHLLAEIPVNQLADAPFSRAPIGTGAWHLVPTDGGQITLEPHPQYFDRQPLLQRLILRFYDDIPSTIEALTRGEVMGVAQIQPSDLPVLLSNPALTPYSALRSGYTAIFANLRHPLFVEREVREALLLGLDRQALIRNVLNGQGVVAHSFLMPTHWAYDPSLPRYTHQPEDAKQLLEEAGWVDSDGDEILDKNGQPFEFNLLTIESDPQLVEVVEELSRQWAELGIKAEPQVVTSAAELRHLLKQRDFDLFVLSTPLSGLPSDPDFYPLWHSSQVTEDGGQNYTSFTSQEADLLLIEARQTLDQERRRAIYSEFQKILARDLPALPLYHPIYNYTVNNIVKDVQIGPLNRPTERFLTLPDWYVKIQRIVLDKGAPTPTSIRP